jgi:hypothetical protein
MKEVRQGPRFSTSRLAVFLEGFARLEGGGQRKVQQRESSQTVFEFALGGEFYGQLGKDDRVIKDGAKVRSVFDLPAGPFHPFGIARQHIGNNARIHKDQTSPRVWRSHSSVRPETLPPRSKAATVLRPRRAFATFTISTPFGWSINCTSHLASRPCFLRKAGGIVSRPLSEILIGSSLRSPVISRAWLGSTLGQTLSST